jgi:hypothetical protein
MFDFCPGDCTEPVVDAEYHVVDGVLYLCHPDDHYCPHETLRIEWTSCTGDARQWLNQHGARREIMSLSDPLYRWGVAQHGQPTFTVEPGDTLCWNGIRVWLHLSCRQEVETCTAKEARMLKFGTGQITTIEKTPAERLTVEASGELTDEERAAILTEGEEAQAEGE